MDPIIPLSAEDIADIVEWAGQIVSDLLPLLVVIIGIAIGAFIVKVILHLKD